VAFLFFLSGLPFYNELTQLGIAEDAFHFEFYEVGYLLTDQGVVGVEDRVGYFAHDGKKVRTCSSTEAYKQQVLDELQADVKKFHPF
jgi:hypothetical protein